MKIASKKLLAAVMGSAALCASGLSHGFFLNTVGAAAPANYNGTFTTFGGFDWDSAANAISVSTGGLGFGNGDTISTTYWATAVNLKNEAGANLLAGQLNIGYEYTILATITETVTCAVFAGPPGPGAPCAIGSFVATGGSYRIWYDDLASGGLAGNLVTGAGITNGTLITSGLINPGIAGSFTATSLTDGFGIFAFDGSASTPAPGRFSGYTASNATSTLQLGRFTTAWTAATGQPGAAGASVALPGVPFLNFQADANQAFVPEPGTIALAGLGLLLAGLRRRKS